MKSSKMSAKELAIIAFLEKKYPNPQCGLFYRNYYELLIATILSAQAKDEVVNQCTLELFTQYPIIHALMQADKGALVAIIKPIGLANVKATNLINLAKIICTTFNGNIPTAFNDLLKLPGVGRKVALVIRSEYFKDECFPVDTHIFRILNRLGYVATQAIQTEKLALKAFDGKVLRKLHLQIITFGRTICYAKKPKCELCELKEYCLYDKK